LEITEREPGDARVPDQVGWLEKGGSALDMASADDYLFLSGGANGAPSTRQGRARMLRRTSAAAAVIAFATVGSALFGGAALANGNGEEPAPVTNTGGPGGDGGKAIGCILVDSTVTQSPTASDEAHAEALFSCTATGGAGGNGGPGSATY
jgi:hypothetical protein